MEVLLSVPHGINAQDAYWRMGPLCRAVVELCLSMRTTVSDETQAKLDHVVSRLGAPLQLAVAGRINSGKSTVVNALLGRRVAPTDVRECTRLVTRFHYGQVDRVDVVRVDGRRYSLPYDPSGLIPVDLGSDVSEIAYLDAFLTSSALESVTVIDTPGLGSLDPESARRADGLLGRNQADRIGEASRGLDAGSQVAISQAEAVLFVLTQATRLDDVEALTLFHRAVPQISSPINAIGVLNKADLVNAAEPMAVASQLATSQAEQLRNRVSDVLPLIGLLAEATETGGFSEADVALLRQIAGLDEPLRTALFYSTDLFISADFPVPVDGRTRLLEKLDLFGVRQAVEFLTVHPGLSTGDIRRYLVDISGFPRLRDLLDQTFRRKIDGIKANVALGALSVIAAKTPSVRDRGTINDGVDKLLQQPDAHHLRLLEAASQVAAGVIDLPTDMAHDMMMLVNGADIPQQLGMSFVDIQTLSNVALERATKWRSFATFGATPSQSRVAHVVHRAYFLLWQQLTSAAKRGIS